MSGKLAEAARKAWVTCPGCKGTGVLRESPGDACPACDGTGKRTPPVEPIGLHECRHTYASLLVAAGYTIKDVMTFLGHADLQTTSRYVKQLPQPGETSAADKLNRYLEACA